ncbi:MAG: DUF2804 domain-containing protein [Oscillospiraceae bacterium]
MKEQRLHRLGDYVLDEKGIPNAGYSTKSDLIFERNKIKAAPWRIKEWDFYQISDDRKCLQFTFGHAAYAGQIGVMLFDFKDGTWIATREKMLVLPFNSLKMPMNADEDGELIYHKGGIEMSFKTAGEVRTLFCKYQDLETSITLKRKNPHALVINLPFDEKKTAFYYNHKINCMTAEGYCKVGNQTYYFDAQNSFGILDWGRGVWPFSNEWYWSNGTGYIDGEIFGFNLGCGFGNCEAATENILFYKGEYHKLGKVAFHLGKNYMDPWVLQDEDNRIELTLYPTYDRTTKTKLLWVDNCCHQMFGEFKGYVTLNDGTKLTIENLYSFAEHAVNNW